MAPAPPRQRRPRTIPPARFRPPGRRLQGAGFLRAQRPHRLFRADARRCRHASMGHDRRRRVPRAVDHPLTKPVGLDRLLRHRLPRQPAPSRRLCQRRWRPLLPSAAAQPRRLARCSRLRAGVGAARNPESGLQWRRLPRLRPAHRPRRRGHGVASAMTNTCSSRGTSPVRSPPRQSPPLLPDARLHSRDHGSAVTRSVSASGAAQRQIT
jgi:hypothetical protein